MVLFWIINEHWHLHLQVVESQLDSLSVKVTETLQKLLQQIINEFTEIGGSILKQSSELGIDIGAEYSAFMNELDNLTVLVSKLSEIPVNLAIALQTLLSCLINTSQELATSLRRLSENIPDINTRIAGIIKALSESTVSVLFYIYI